MNILAIGSSGFRFWAQSLQEDGETVIETARDIEHSEYLINKSRFDCVLVEYRGMIPAEARTLLLLRRRREEFRIVGVVENDTGGLRMQAVGAGADFCLSRRVSKSEFLLKLRTVILNKMSDPSPVPFKPCDPHDPCSETCAYLGCIR